MTTLQAVAVRNRKLCFPSKDSVCIHAHEDERGRMLAYKLAERLLQGKDRYFLSEIMWLVLYRIQKL